MSSLPHVLASAPWKAVRNAKYEVAILPWGATEPHNLHLPFGTDIIESEYVASESARRSVEAGAKVIVLPAIPYGVNTGQLDLNMTVNMNPATQMMILKDVVDSLSQHKIPKIVILNSHGGNDFKQMIRELQPKHPGVFLCTINWWQVVDQKQFFDEKDDHAGEMETSVMLALAPDLVLPLSEAGPGTTRQFRLKGLREGWAWAPRDWSEVSDDTGAGNPRKATAEKGQKYLAAVTARIAEFLTELSRANIRNLYEKS
jgi:creatinine amidohydrolase